MNNNKEPWELYPSLWKTQAEFFVYLRGQLRRIWSRYPAKHEWKKSQLIPPPAGYKGRAKKLGKCFYCNQMFAASHLEVDHIEMAGSCGNWLESSEFTYKLLDCNDNWVLSCKPCHKVKSYAERMEISFEEALLQKRVIEFCKQKKQIILDFLALHQYNGSSVSSADKRRKLIEKIFKEKLDATGSLD